MNSRRVDWNNDVVSNRFYYKGGSREQGSCLFSEQGIRNFLISGGSQQERCGTAAELQECLTGRVSMEILHGNDPYMEASIPFVWIHLPANLWRPFLMANVIYRKDYRMA